MFSLRLALGRVGLGKLGSILARHEWVRHIWCCHSCQKEALSYCYFAKLAVKSLTGLLWMRYRRWFLLHETCINNLYCVGQSWGLTWITKRSMLYTHACMTEHRWVTACACFELPSQIPQAWVWHTIIITLRLLLGPPLLLDTEFNLPWYKTLSCQSNPLSLCTIVSPSSAPFVVVCSQLQGSLYAGLGGPVWNAVRRGKAGTPA